MKNFFAALALALVAVTAQGATNSISSYSPFNGFLDGTDHFPFNRGNSLAGWTTKRVDYTNIFKSVRKDMIQSPTNRFAVTDANSNLVGSASSAALAATLTDETGTGAAVMSSGAVLTNVTVTNITGYTLYLTNVYATNVNVTNLGALNMRGTNVTITNLSAIGVILTNVNVTNITGTSFNLTNGTLTGVILNNVTISNATEITNLSLASPVIGSFTNANHGHTNVNSGGLLTLQALGAVRATANLSSVGTLTPGNSALIRFVTNANINASNTLNHLSFDENAAITLAFTNVQIRCYVTGNVAMAYIKNTSAANPVSFLGTVTYTGIPAQ